MGFFSSPLFLSAFELRNAGAVLHSHSSNVVLMTMLARRLDEELSVLEFTHTETLYMFLWKGRTILVSSYLDLKNGIHHTNQNLLD